MARAQRLRRAIRDGRAGAGLSWLRWALRTDGACARAQPHGVPHASQVADARRAARGGFRGRLRGQRDAVPQHAIRRRRPACHVDDRGADARVRWSARSDRGVRAAAGAAARARLHRRVVDRPPAAATHHRVMLELDAITIATPERVLIRRLSARVGAGEVLVVMGESGSGKSSLLAMLAGTLPASLIASGGIRLDGRDIGELPTAQRRVGILFQDDLLFPHMSVLDNLLFAIHDGVRAQRVAQAEAALRSADLAGHGTRWPATLSGGQRARVAVLRALLAQPQALLL